MNRYGNIHRVSDFIFRTIPKRGSGKYDELFVHRVIKHLQFLDSIQASNPWITLAVNAGDGIWLSYKGRRTYLTLPALNKLRVLVPRDGPKDSLELVRTIEASQKRGIFSDISHQDYHQWHAEAAGLAILEDFLQKLSKDVQGLEVEEKLHPRSIPGDVRQAALEAFERGGSFCPGVDRKRNGHRVDRVKERIEFDHILPHSKGGSGSFLNVQVLCQDCNRIKRDTPA